MRTVACFLQMPRRGPRDLVVLQHAKTRDEYGDAELIPRNASVVVVRQPTQYPPLRPDAAQHAAAATAAPAPAAPAPAPPAPEDDFGGEVFSQHAVPPVLPDHDAAPQACASGQTHSWEELLAAGRQGRGQGRAGAFTPGGGLRPPAAATCPRCQKWHWLKECPVLRDAAAAVKRIGERRVRSAEGTVAVPGGGTSQLQPTEEASKQGMAISLSSGAPRASAVSALHSPGAAAPGAAAASPAPAADGSATTAAAPPMLAVKPHALAALPFSGVAMQLAPQLVSDGLVRGALLSADPCALYPAAARGANNLGGLYSGLLGGISPQHNALFANRLLSPAEFAAMQTELAAAAVPTKGHWLSGSTRRSRSRSPERSHRSSRDRSRPHGGRERSRSRSRARTQRSGDDNRDRFRGAAAVDASRRSERASQPHVDRSARDRWMEPAGLLLQVNPKP